MKNDFFAHTYITYSSDTATLKKTNDFLPHPTSGCIKGWEIKPKPLFEQEFIFGLVFLVVCVVIGIDIYFFTVHAA